MGTDFWPTLYIYEKLIHVMQAVTSYLFVLPRRYYYFVVLQGRRYLTEEHMLETEDDYSF